MKNFRVSIARATRAIRPYIFFIMTATIAIGHILLQEFRH